MASLCFLVWLARRPLQQPKRFKKRRTIMLQVLLIVVTQSEQLSTSNRAHANFSSTDLPIKVKLISLTCTLDLTGISLLQISLNDIITILPDSPETRFLHNCCNNSA
jgi:hypothetical protein